MVGVILAAGIGSRLNPLTDTKPKCMVRVAGKPILQYQLDAYKAAGITDIFIVVGYFAEIIADYCKHIKDINIHIVENVDFESTNNMYSLFLLRDQLDSKPFILNNADLVIEPAIVKAMVEDNPEDLIAVDVGSYNAESMKVTINSNQVLTDISKGVSKSKAYGCSIDFYKLSASTSKELFGKIDTVVVGAGDRNQWTEVALQDLMHSGRIAMKPHDIGKARWVEVDNYEDLEAADYLFSDIPQLFEESETIFLDLDGTVYVGDTPIEKAAQFVERMRTKNKQVYFLSNNSSRVKRQYVEKLKSFGITADEKDIILSSDGLISYLQKSKVRAAYVLGTESLRTLVASAGIDTDSKNPEYVVVGYDTELTYAKLSEACRFINQGVDYIATHEDVSCPTEHGPIPDIGSLLTLLEMTTTRPPFKIFGKPHASMVEHVDGVNLAKSLFIGDRTYTDMALAEVVGGRSLLVLSGETTRDSLDDFEEYNGPYVSSLTRLADSIS